MIYSYTEIKQKATEKYAENKKF
ncbi:MAG: hypothetical protein RLZZ292_2056, partial [Bacteroidota bacterium]